MWTTEELKRIGKAAFRANYWRSVASALLLSLLLGGMRAASSRNNGAAQEGGQDVTGTLQNFVGEDPKRATFLIMALLGVGTTALIIGLILRIFIFNPLQVGCYGFFAENIRSGGEADLSVISTGFGYYGHAFVTLFLRDLYIFLWCLLLVIPGFMKAYSYRMVPFILREHPDWTSSEILRSSEEMMRGHRMQAFLFDLSFLGWYILGALTLGLVDVFWTEPYRQNANAAMYLAMCGE